MGVFARAEPLHGLFVARAEAGRWPRIPRPGPQGGSTPYPGSPPFKNESESPSFGC
jgi:hypothetical protein